MLPAPSSPPALGTFMEPVAKDKILNTLRHWKREENQQAFQVGLGNSTPQFSGQQSGASSPRPKPAASGWRRSGADGRAGQVGSVRTVPKHVGIGRLEELDVVLHAAVGALRLLQAILQVLEPALVATVSLRGEGARGTCVRRQNRQVHGEAETLLVVARG